MLVVVLVVSVSSLSAETDVIVEGRVAYPRMREIFDPAPGGNIQARSWVSDHWGIGLSGGYENMGAGYDTDRIPIAGAVLNTDVAGAARAFPIGLHAVYRFNSAPEYRAADWTASIGLNYTHMGSGAMIESVFVPAAGPSVAAEWDIEIDDAYFVELQIAYEDKIPWLGDQRFVIGAGYRYDISRGDATVDAIELEKELDLSGFYARFGLLFPIN